MSFLSTLLLESVLRLARPGRFLAQLAEACDGQQFARIVHAQRRRADAPSPPPWIRRGYRVRRELITGSALHIFQPAKGPQAGKVLLYFPGGAYVSGPSSIHWAALRSVARGCGAAFTLFDYPKAPEHTAQDALAAAVGACEYLMERMPSAEIVLMGDSAGAGLALAAAVHQRDRGGRLPAKLVLFSPWLDAGLTHTEIEPLEGKDLMLHREGLRACAASYASGLSLEHPWVSPKKSSLEGLPPMLLTAGGREIFWPDIRDLVDGAQKQGWPVALVYEPHLPHAYPLFPQMPESTRALRTTASFICGP